VKPKTFVKNPVVIKKKNSSCEEKGRIQVEKKVEAKTEAKVDFTDSEDEEKMPRKVSLSLSSIYPSIQKFFRSFSL